MTSLLDRLKQRKLFQWAFAYVASGWLVAEVMDVLAEPWGLSGGIRRGVMALLALGLPIVLVLAWYHGEKGRQRVSGPEFVILTSLILLAGVALTVFNPLEDSEPVSVEVVARAIDPNSVVVLPFLNMSSDPDQEFMSDAISVTVLSLLDRIPELKVTPRRTAFSFKGRDDLTIPEIAAELGVANVLDGTVQRVGNAIKITFQIVDARADTLLLSQSYDRVFDSIFAVQNDIAAKVVSALKLTLLGELPTLQETDPQAYTLFLQARGIANTITQENYERVIPMFERVLEIDSAYAPAYAELAVVYHDQALNGSALPWEERLQMSITAAERALSLDPDFAYAMAILGSGIAHIGDVERGARHIARALELVRTTRRSF